MMCVFLMFWLFFENVLSTCRSESYQKHFGIISRLYQNQPYQNHAKQPWGNRPKTCPRVVSCFFSSQPIGNPKKKRFPSSNHIQIISETYQNPVTIVSKPYQIHIKTIKKRARNRPKACPLGYFCFLFPSQPIRSPEQAAPFPNHIKIISKTISKS